MTWVDAGSLPGRCNPSMVNVSGHCLLTAQARTVTWHNLHHSFSSSISLGLPRLLFLVSKGYVTSLPIPHDLCYRRCRTLLVFAFHQTRCQTKSTHINSLRTARSWHATSLSSQVRDRHGHTSDLSLSCTGISSLLTWCASQMQQATEAYIYMQKPTEPCCHVSDASYPRSHP